MKILKNVCTRFARRTASVVRMSAIAAFALAAGSVSAATTFSYTVSSQDNTAGTYSATGGKVTIGASSKVESKNSKYGYNDYCSNHPDKRYTSGWLYIYQMGVIPI